MARNKVPVYSTHGNHLRYTTLADAEALIELGNAKRVSRLKAPLKIQLTQLERVDGSSPCSISYQEVLANVGLSHRRGEHNFVSAKRKRQVQEKIGNFLPSWRDRVVSA
jgi:hypothetical protein